MDILTAADVEGGMLHENQILDYVESQLRLISRTDERIAGNGEDIHKLLMLYATLLAPIIGDVFSVEIVDKQRNCEKWWTLPLLAGLVFFSIGVALISELWQQFSSHKQRRQLEDNLNVRVEFVINNVGAGTIWMNLRTLILIQAMLAEINEPRQKRIGVVWYTERAALVVTMVGFWIVLLISCTRLRC